MRVPDLSQIVWRKSSRSAPCSANCVEIGNNSDLVLVRDSLDPQGPALAFSGPSWVSFLDGIRNRNFDIP